MTTVALPSVDEVVDDVGCLCLRDTLSRFRCSLERSSDRWARRASDDDGFPFGGGRGGRKAFFFDFNTALVVATAQSVLRFECILPYNER